VRETLSVAPIQPFPAGQHLDFGGFQDRVHPGRRGVDHDHLGRRFVGGLEQIAQGDVAARRRMGLQLDGLTRQGEGRRGEERQR
jgi:hypothetical protein